ncbi:MAG: ATP-binding protein, partial [Candidatus Pacebacteria bacterium]|nr:ATP-binding protein [Candidatus Paceibacterota bacterium]
KIKLEKEYSKNLLNINADLNIMRMVLQNLISNAVKYTTKGGRISVKISKEEKNFTIEVSNTGYGIPKNQQDKIFTKLFRADNAREIDPEGNGLGLYIVKSIINSAGGKIWFNSVENETTTFYVSIPIQGMEKKEGVKGLIL